MLAGQEKMVSESCQQLFKRLFSLLFTEKLGRGLVLVKHFVLKSAPLPSASVCRGNVHLLNKAAVHGREHPECLKMKGWPISHQDHLGRTGELALLATTALAYVGEAHASTRSSSTHCSSEGFSRKRDVPAQVEGSLS